eukprot:scaffold2999_cov113-Cylindrotheca_fusiformis.AAC.3
MLKPSFFHHNMVVVAILASLCALTTLPQISFAEELGDGGDFLSGLCRSLAPPAGTERTCIESPDFEGERCFFTFIPDCAGEDSPLVYDLHGLTSCPVLSMLYTGWKEKAKEHCFVLVIPDGTMDRNMVDSNCWGLPGGLQNDQGTTSLPCCCSKNSAIPVVVPGEGPFLRQIAAVLSRDVPIQTSGSVTIDTKRIYMAGHSNGCIASIYMAAQFSDMVAAVGCHSGTAVAPFPVETYNPRPIAMIHGTIDSTLSYNSTSFWFSASDTYFIISEMNGCTMFNETTISNGANNFATRFASTNCTNNATVVMYALDDVGHFPFPVETFAFLNGPGAAPVVVDTTKWMWDFVKQYSLEEAPDLVVTLSTDAPTPVTVVTPSPSSASRPRNSYFFLMATIMILMASQQ